MLDPRRHQRGPLLLDWLQRNGASGFLSVMTITEMDSGMLKLRRDSKDARAAEIAVLMSAIVADFGDRVLPMDVETARSLARLAEETIPQAVALPDLIIAATAARHGLTVLTRNLKDFRRLSVPARDPFTDLPADV
jgi:toxin FitB